MRQDIRLWLLSVPIANSSPAFKVKWLPLAYFTREQNIPEYTKHTVTFPSQDKLPVSRTRDTESYQSVSFILFMLGFLKKRKTRIFFFYMSASYSQTTSMYSIGILTQTGAQLWEENHTWFSKKGFIGFHCSYSFKSFASLGNKCK